jgi:hypothetical protein
MAKDYLDIITIDGVRNRKNDVLRVGMMKSDPWKILITSIGGVHKCSFAVTYGDLLRWLRYWRREYKRLTGNKLRLAPAPKKWMMKYRKG